MKYSNGLLEHSSEDTSRFNVLKWHWWRFNGEGYFWGMTAGVIAAIVMKFTVPDAWVLYFFPVLFGVSLIGCIAGTYSAPPTDEETLINFYTRVRPWGWWKPIEEKALVPLPSYPAKPQLQKETHSTWQSALCGNAALPLSQCISWSASNWGSGALLHCFWLRP